MIVIYEIPDEVTRKKTKPRPSQVSDIRLARLKKLSREFFDDVGVLVPDAELVDQAFEFIAIFRDTSVLPSQDVKKLVEKHSALMSLLDELRREKDEA